jgi:hypothetical protein
MGYRKRLISFRFLSLVVLAVNISPLEAKGAI